MECDELRQLTSIEREGINTEGTDCLTTRSTPPPQELLQHVDQEEGQV